jgi:hypothetical protein
LKSGQNNVAVTSAPIQAKFEFDAVAPHWTETDGNDKTRSVSIRMSEDGQHWTDWTAVEVMRPQKDTKLHADEVFPEAPLIALGSYFQYKVALHRVGDEDPQIQDLTVTYIDSRPTLGQKISSAWHGVFDTPVADASGKIPHVISRADWGSPDPTGEMLHGQDAYWIPAYHPVTQFFVHHTVDSNYASAVDGASLVRAIWQYHTYTLGWGDIGYNYLVDENGNVYQGRAHGDNIDGGHVYGYNSGSMGVALIGCFQPNDSSCKSLDRNNVTGPSGAMLDSLTDLLAWKANDYEIDPQGQHTFCKGDGSNCLNFYTIAGHRDGYPTSCPGDLAYADLQTIRDQTAAKKTAQYTYAAKQATLPSVTVGVLTQKSVTMSFKNAGTVTWVNSGANPLTLRTANPTDHTSMFEGIGWVSQSIVATLNESSVAPGQTGTFTFKVKYPTNSSTDDWWEYFRLTINGLYDLPETFGLPIHYISEVPWTFSNLDGGSSPVSGTGSVVGQQPAATEFGGDLHAFYYDKTAGNLMHAYKDTSWHFETLDGAGGAGGRLNADVGRSPSVTVFNSALNVFFYDATNGDLRHAWSDNTGSNWQFETLDGSGGANGRYNANVGMTPAAVAYGTTLQLFYYDATNGNLRHAWTLDGTTWKFENLDGDIGSIGRLEANLGADPAVTTFGTTLQLFYYDASHGNLRHAWSNETGWHFENLDGDPGSIGHMDSNLGSTPAVLPFGTSLQVMYYDIQNGNLRHAWATATGWHFENLDGDPGSIGHYNGNVGITPSLAQSSDGDLHVFYYESSGDQGDLRHAYADASGWHFEPLDGSGGLPSTRVNGNAGINAAATSGSYGLNVWYEDVNSGALRLANPQ